MRSLVSASAHGWIGNSPGLKSTAMLTRYFALSVPQMPARSGLPSAFRDTGAVSGVPLPCTRGHCAAALEHRIRIKSASLDIRRLLDHRFRGKIALKPIEQMTQ